MVQIHNEGSRWSKVDGLASVVIASYLPLRKKMAWRGYSPTCSFHCKLFYGHASARKVQPAGAWSILFSYRDFHIALWLTCVTTATVVAQIEQTSSLQLSQILHPRSEKKGVLSMLVQFIHPNTINLVFSTQTFRISQTTRCYNQVSSIFTSCFGIELRFFSKYDRLK